MVNPIFLINLLKMTDRENNNGKTAGNSEKKKSNPWWDEMDDRRKIAYAKKEIFSCLNLKICDCLYKSEHHKQSDQSFKKRKEIEKYIFLKEGVCLKNKKILLVDDICTTGSTLRAAIKLVKQSNPKKIEILVVARRDFSKDELKQISGYIDVLK